MKTDTVDKILEILEKHENNDTRMADCADGEYAQGYENSRVDFASARARQAILALAEVGEKNP